MPSIYELANSPEITNTIQNPSATRRYRIDGVTDELLALSMATAFSPATYLNLVREAVSVKPIEASGGTMWDAEVPYVKLTLAPLQVGEARVHYQTTGGTRKMTQSLETKRVYGSTTPVLPGVGLDWFGSLIGVTSDGVEGVDIIAPNFEWTEERTFLTGTVTTAYMAGLFLLTGSVNDAYFRGFNAGECLFLGAEADKSTSDHWKFIFHFKGSPGFENLNFGPFLGVSKEGWDYAWTFDVPSLNTTQNLIVKKPELLIIEKVYYRRNFAGLGIGTASLLP